MKKKLLAVVLSAIMAATMLAGCGETVETGQNAEDAETQVEDESAVDEPEKSESDAVEPEEIVFMSAKTTTYFYYSDDLADYFESRCDKYEYDAAGNMTKFIRLKPDGSIGSEDKYENEYDAAGNWIKQTRYDNEGRISMQSEMEYISIIPVPVGE